MKKIRFLLCCLAIILVGIACKHPKEIVIIPDIEKNHLQQNHIFGQVREIRTESFSLKDSNQKIMEDKPLSIMIQHYSSDGFLTEVIKMNPAGDTLSVEKLHYSADGKVQERNAFWGNDTIASGKTIFEYNHYGFKSKETYYMGDSLLWDITYKTDDKGNVVEMYVNRNEPLRHKIFYNKVGLLARMEEYEPNGKLFKYVTIEYDNYGDEVNRRVFKSNDELIEYTYKQYNQQGRLLKTIYEDRLHDSQEVSKYDQHDAEGNWLHVINTTNGQPVYGSKRTIQYY